MKNLIVVLIFAFIPSLSFCQEANDYVIDLKGDTLRGRVRILSLDPVDQVQVVINKKKTTLTATKARAIFFENETYHSVRNGNTQKFMKVIKSGFLSLYAYKLPNQTRYDGLFLAKRNGQSMDVPNLGFKKIMAEFLAECPAVSEGLKDETLKRNDLNKIVDTFNKCNETAKKENTSVKLLSTDSGKEKFDALEAFQKKVEGVENFTAKKDVLDVLQDIKVKLEKQEPIPSYLYGVLKTHVADQPTLTEDLDKLIALLSK